MHQAVSWVTYSVGRTLGIVKFTLQVVDCPFETIRNVREEKKGMRLKFVEIPSIFINVSNVLVPERMSLPVLGWHFEDAYRFSTLSIAYN